MRSVELVMDVDVEVAGPRPIEPQRWFLGLLKTFL
jgi:hypothetical protein